MINNPLVSVCIPTYNSERLITKALTSILDQSYKHIEIIISDDCSRDNTIKRIKAIKSPKIRILKNGINLGYAKNIQQFKDHIQGDIIFLMAQDDILINDGIKLVVNEFVKNPKIGAVTRPYYWFADDPRMAIRHIPPINKKKTVTIDIKKKPELIIPIIESVGQLSGLAYRTDIFSQFQDDVFPAHIYPFMEILKTHKCSFLNEYTIAVGTYDSQTRSKSSIYDKSPALSWFEMFNSVFSEKRFKKVREIGIDHMAKNYVGLIQIKNYAKTSKILFREIFLLIKSRPLNLVSYKFWFIALGVIIVPRKILIWMVDNYKNNLLSRKLRGCVI